jgi:hypothetical protein
MRFGLKNFSENQRKWMLEAFSFTRIARIFANFVKGNWPFVAGIILEELEGLL